MTRGGAIAGYAIDGYSKLPSVMFISGEDHIVYNLTEGGWLIDAKSDKNGFVYALVSENNSLQLFFVSKNDGIVSKAQVAEASLYSYYGDGGLYIDETGGVVYLVVPTDFLFGGLYFQFLSVFELELNDLFQKDYYILGWDGSYLPILEFGGIEGANLFGRYDDQSFVYNLVSRDLRTYVVCDDEYTIARGVVFNDWLVGEVGSASLFFQNLKFKGKIVLDFQFDYFENWSVSDEKIVVQADNQFYIFSIKN